MDSRRVVPWLVACGAHLAAFTALHAVKPLPVPSPPEIAETEVDFEPLPPEQPAAETASPPAPGPIGAKQAPAGHRSAGSLHAAAAAARDRAQPESRATETQGPEIERQPSEGWSFNPMAPGSLDTHLSHAQAAGAGRREHGEPLPRGDGPSTTGGIDEGLAAHDVEVGLGRGGAVLVAAEEAAHGPDAPLQGFATIDIAIREGGALDAHVVNASNDAEGWARVAGALKHIDPARLRLPPGAHGWHVTVRLEAKVQFPDGRDPRTLHGWRAGLNPSVIQRQVEGDPEARGSATGPGGPDHIADPGGHEPPPDGGALGGRQANNPGAALIQGALMRVLPAPTLAVQGKVCSLSISIVGPGVALSGGCSPENIGVGTTRVVSGKIVSEGAL